MTTRIVRTLRWRRTCPYSGVPELQLLAPGVLLSLVWEGLQSPFYADTYTAPWRTVMVDRLHCAGGDGMILLVTFWTVAWRWGRSWMCQAHWAPLLAFLTLGVAYTVASEYVNVFVRQRWAYSPWMPRVAGIGLVPLLQWVVVPALSVRLARGAPCCTGACVPSVSLEQDSRSARGRNPEERSVCRP
jgi:hypothetical protein